MSELKRIGGKSYRYYSTEPTKTIANDEARILREEENARVRIVKTKFGYELWIR